MMAIEKLMLALVSDLTTLASQDEDETSKTVAKNNYDIPVVKKIPVRLRDWTVFRRRYC